MAALRPRKRPPAGRRDQPDLRLDDGTRLCDHTRHGRALLVDLAGDDQLAVLAKRYAERVQLVRGQPDGTKRTNDTNDTNGTDRANGTERR